MYTIRSAGPNKGLGVFATKLIPRGTRILSERALISIPEKDGGSLPRDLFTAFNTLSREQQQSILDLSSYPGEGIGRLGRWGSALSYTLRKKIRGQNRERRGIWRGMGENKRVLDIWRSNSFDIAHAKANVGEEDGRGARVRATFTASTLGSEGRAKHFFHLFPTIARLNHSCLPNAQANYLPSRASAPSPSPLSSQAAPLPPPGTFNIHALSDIPTGTEIQISYLPEHGSLTSHRRSKLLSGYGFLCQCPACDHSTTSAKRGEEQRLEMKGRLAEFSSGTGVEGKAEEEYYYDSEGNRESFSVSEDARGVEKEVGERGEGKEGELEITLEYIKMLEEQGVSGREVATIYYSVAGMLEGQGRKAEALEKAERGLEIDGDCLGEDHPLYNEMAGFVDGLRKQ